MSTPPPPTYNTYKYNSSAFDDDAMIKLHEIAPIAYGGPPPPPYIPHIPLAIVPGPGPAAIVPGPGPAAIVPGPGPAAMIPLHAFMVPGPGPAAIVPGPGPGGLFHGIPVQRRVLGAAVAITLVGGMIGGILAFLPRNDNQCYRQHNGDTLCTINWLHKHCVSNEDGNMVCPSLCISDEYCPSVPQDPTTQIPGPR